MDRTADFNQSFDTNSNETENFQFSELFNISWARSLMPCTNWREPQHVLFQAANCCFLLSCLTTNSNYGVISMHAILILGYLLYSTWAWNVICAPDIFSWTFGFTLLNLAHVLHGLYRMHPVRLEPELENAYKKLFEPLGVSRLSFTKLACSEYANILSLQAGEAYALQNLTRSDRLSLLLSGKVQVVSGRTVLHWIESNEFLDSPEFESSRPPHDDKFRVSILAASSCRYLCWQRSALQYLLAKETHLATVLGILVARDVTSKIFAMNKKIAFQKGVYLDVRLAGIAGYFDKSGFRHEDNERADIKRENGTISCSALADI